MTDGMGAAEKKSFCRMALFGVDAELYEKVSEKCKDVFNVSLSNRQKNGISPGSLPATLPDVGISGWHNVILAGGYNVTHRWHVALV